MYLRQFVISLLIVLLAACAGPKPYAPPPGVTPQNGATIFGTIRQIPNLFIKDHHTYIVRIDGTLTLTGPKGWKKKLLLAEGVHKIVLGVSEDDGFGFTKEFEFGPVRAGEVFVARSEKVAEGIARAWIENEDGVILTEKFAVGLSRGSPPFTPIILVR